MAKAPARKLEALQRHPDRLRFPLEPLHGWRGAPHEGGHSHCLFCGETIYPGDLVVGCYL